MLAKNVGRVGWRFLRNMHQVHVNLIHFAPALAMVTARAGRHQICPNMLAAHVARNHMIHRQTAVAPAAILAGIIIAAEYFAAR